ncbi:hypothetical protein [Herbaspirillum robiniae]|uniref:SRPBCC family protein n=1 Tax=Herbaspirillum robiniae TaxID=2014887 RepID=A0ABX2LSP4_9BURK|nr:hypothetical protein [Herbaspirillum robiniae]NUU01567.1 hypothetical protein [Herbaspirillum robiniae]
MPTLRGSYRRLEAPSDIFYLEISYQIGPSIRWAATISGGSREVEAMSGELELRPKSDIFIRDAIISTVRSRVKSALDAIGA